MKRMKRGFRAAFIPLLCLCIGFAASGCAVEREKGSEKESESESAKSEGDKITIRIMHYWGNTDTDISARHLNEILDHEFSEAFPGVELVQETCDNET